MSEITVVLDRKPFALCLDKVEFEITRSACTIKWCIDQAPGFRDLDIPLLTTSIEVMLPNGEILFSGEVNIVRIIEKGVIVISANAEISEPPV